MCLYNRFDEEVVSERSGDEAQQRETTLRTWEDVQKTMPGSDGQAVPVEESAELAASP